MSSKQPSGEPEPVNSAPADWTKVVTGEQAILYFLAQKPLVDQALRIFLTVAMTSAVIIGLITAVAMLLGLDASGLIRIVGVVIGAVVAVATIAYGRRRRGLSSKRRPTRIKRRCSSDSDESPQQPQQPAPVADG